MPLSENASVTLTSHLPGVPPLHTGRVAVVIAKEQPGGEDALYELVYDAGLAYPDGTAIQALDLLSYPDLTPHRALLRQPVVMRGVWAYAITQFLVLSLPGSISNARTAFSGPGRVDLSSSTEHLEGLPPEVVIRRWTIVQPFDVTDIVVGDRLSAASLGTYRVLTRDFPRTFQEFSAVTCVRVDQPGGYELPMDPNQFLYCENYARSERTASPVPMYIEQLPSEIAVQAGMKFPFVIHLPPDVTFPSGKPLSAGDGVKWSELPDGRASFKELRHIYGPLERYVSHLDKSTS